MSEEHNQNLELLKLSFDWCKHISSLSTGSTVLMVTFLEKLANQPRWKILLVASLIGFVISIFGALCVQLEHLTQEKYVAPTTFGMISALATLGGFLIGMVSLTAFAIRNLI